MSKKVSLQTRVKQLEEMVENLLIKEAGWCGDEEMIPFREISTLLSQTGAKLLNERVKKFNPVCPECGSKKH